MTGRYVLGGHDGRTPVPCRDDAEWDRMWRKIGERRVASTKIGFADVSTVFLGMDHSWGGSEGPPLLFETLVLAPDLASDGEMHRYATWEEAEEGHAAVCRSVELEVEMEWWDRRSVRLDVVLFGLLLVNVALMLYNVLTGHWLLAPLSLVFGILFPAWVLRRGWKLRKERKVSKRTHEGL